MPFNLVLGLAGPYGAGSSSLAEELVRAINDWPRCHAEIIKVSSLIEDYYPHIIGKELQSDIVKSRTSRREELQRAGTELRMKDPRLVGKLISTKIYEQGSSIEEHDSDNLSISAFIVDSLKNKNDVELLRRTYEDEFYLIFVNADRETRWRRLKDYKSWNERERTEFDQIDAIDSNEKSIKPDIGDAGQQIGILASIADYYVVSDQNREQLRADGMRLFRMLLGDGANQPTKHERCMHIAYSASNRSFCLSRQVGAAIFDSNENILGLGYNDVPKFKGGLYTVENGKTDKRCYLVGDRRCINDTNKEERFERLANRIYTCIGVEECEEQKEDVKDIIENSDFKDATEYCRAVHAEMEAILSVCRNSQGSTIGSSMFVTTMPCHNCAKHIICAGVKEVIYIEPYPKSLAEELHSDALMLSSVNTNCPTEKVLFIPYRGAAPNRFHTFFVMDGERKDKSGRIKNRSKEDQANFPKFGKHLEKRARGNKNPDNITLKEMVNAVEIHDLVNNIGNTGGEGEDGHEKP